MRTIKEILEEMFKGKNAALEKYAKVRIGRNSACDACGKCGMTQNQKYIDITVENSCNAVVGDTVGDPLKDTVGPCLDIFIKIMSTIALVTVVVFYKYNLLDYVMKWLG